VKANYFRAVLSKLAGWKPSSAKTVWLVLLAALIFSLWPMKTKQFSLVPSYARQELGLSDIKPLLQGVNRLNPGHFKIFIGLDYAENPGIRSIAEHNQVVQEMDDEELIKRAKSYPWRYAKSIAFPIATFQRKNSCSLRLVLGNGPTSDPVDCKSIEDNHLVTFNFENWIKPGIYEAAVESSGEPGQEIAPYYATTPNNEMWILPSQGRTSVHFWDYIQALTFRSGYVAATYIVIMLVLFWALIGKSSDLVKLATIYFCSIVFTNLATMPFSGYDETAHVSMYHEALKGTSLTKMDDGEFNFKTWQAMAEADFFRLHSVVPQMSNECPHSVLGHCGLTSNPVELYSKFTLLLNHLGLNFQEPKEVVMAARIINVGMILLLVFFAALVLTKDEMHNFIVALIFLSGLIVQSASLTNDVPMYILGLIALLAYAVVLNRKKLLPGVFAVFTLVISYYFFRTIDVSSLSVLPLVLGVIFLISFKSIFNNQPPVHEQFRASSLRLSRDFLGLVGLVLIFVVFYVLILSKTSVMDHLQLLEPRTILLHDMKRLTMENIPGILWSYWKSYIGTFVWGHSYWPAWYYVAAFFAYLCAVYRGLAGLKCKFNSTQYYLLIILIAGIISIQLLSILSIAAGPSFMADPIARDSYAKVRLTAPLAVGILILPMLSVRLLSQGPLANIIKLWLVIFAMASCFWLPTRFFFADIF
jgi:hypothetical protein